MANPLPPSAPKAEPQDPLHQAPLLIAQLRPEDLTLLERLRAHRVAHRHAHHNTGAPAAVKIVPDPGHLVVPDVAPQPLSFSQRLADQVASVVGSWRFIIIQSLLIAAWIVYNLLAPSDKAWDPYPFILLNLFLSFQAAYTAPAIMMSQNRQATVDRQQAQNDYEVNVKAELEIELLHQKVDLMKERELLELTQAIRELSARLEDKLGKPA